MLQDKFQLGTSLNSGAPSSVLARSGLEKRFILILVQFLEIFFEIFEEEVSDYLS